MFKKFLNGIVGKILIIGLAVMQVPSNVLAFGNKSHEQLSELAFHRVLEDLHLTQHLRATPILVNQCTGPDRDEKKGIGGYYEAHFFNANTDLDKRDTALTRMEHHYEYAVKYAKGSDWKGAVKELARALHYLQDMCCPVHMWGYSHNNIPGLLTVHVELEAKWDLMWDSERILRYIPVDDSTLSSNPLPLNARDCGLTFNRISLDRHSSWLSKSGPQGDIAMAINTVNPFFWLVRLILYGIDSTKSGFDLGWEDIFVIPYMASYTLVRMWAETVQHFTPPNPACPIQ